MKKRFPFLIGAILLCLVLSLYFGLGGEQENSAVSDSKKTSKPVEADSQELNAEKPITAVGHDNQTFFSVVKQGDKYSIDGIVGATTDSKKAEKMPKTSDYGLTAADEKPFIDAMLNMGGSKG